MKELMFFDANCGIGNTIIGPRPDVRELLQDMDFYGIDRALVRHNNLAWGIIQTNDSIAEMLKEDKAKRLTGVWCILPEQCDEIPKPDKFFSLMKKHRIGAITLDPFNHRYVACRLTLGKILDAAAERRVPVLLNAYAGKWQELYNFLEMFPKITSIYTEAWGKWGIDRQIRPLLETYENFYFGTAGYWVPGGLADMAGKYGAERIIFGSGYPGYNQGNGMLQLKQSGLDAKSIAKIAGKNLEKLLKGAQI